MQEKTNDVKFYDFIFVLPIRLLICNTFMQ